jgi:twitching motility protein PilT
MDFKALIHSALDQKATDVHLTVGIQPMFRIDGVLCAEGTYKLVDEDIAVAVNALTTPEQKKELDSVGEIDFAVTYENVIRMRCNIFYQQGHAAAALRLLPMRIPTKEELDMPQIIVDQAEKPRGLILVTGPTGSGKSSTLAAMIAHINEHSSRHVITLENPIEYIHPHNKCVVNQREVGQDTESFAAGLRAALRQDPDVILVGEMRDLETISTAITAAETGHLVLGTLHTKSAADTIGRVIDVFPPEQQEQIRIQLAEVLECVVAKELLPRIGGGRVAAYEILLAVPAVRSLIRQNKSFQITSTMQTSKRQGMQLMDDALADLVNRRIITLETALEHAADPVALSTHCIRR